MVLWVLTSLCRYQNCSRIHSFSASLRSLTQTATEKSTLKVCSILLHSCLMLCSFGLIKLMFTITRNYNFTRSVPSPKAWCKIDIIVTPLKLTWEKLCQHLKGLRLASLKWLLTVNDMQLHVAFIVIFCDLKIDPVQCSYNKLANAVCNCVIKMHLNVHYLSTTAQFCFCRRPSLLLLVTSGVQFTTCDHEISISRECFGTVFILKPKTT